MVKKQGKMKKSSAILKKLIEVFWARLFLCYFLKNNMRAGPRT